MSIRLEKRLEDWLVLASLALSVASALALSTIALPPPLLYVIPALLATIAVYAQVGLSYVLRIGVGAILAELLIGLTLIRGEWEASCFPLLALASHIIVVSSLPVMLGYERARVWLWLSLALTGLCWGLEARSLSLSGFTPDTVIGRAHLVLLALSAISLLYVNMVSDRDWFRVIAVVSAVSPVLVVGLIQGGLLAGDAYPGSPLALLYSLYAVAVAGALLSADVKASESRLRREEEWVLRVGVILALSLALASVILEVIGLAGAREHAELLRSLKIPGSISLILLTGAISGSSIGAVGAALVALSIPWLMLRLKLAPLVWAYLAGYIFASLVLVFTARRQLKLYAPLLLIVIMLPLLLEGAPEPARRNTLLVDLNSTVRDHVTQVVVTVGSIENLAYDSAERAVKGELKIAIEYEGARLDETLSFRYYYDIREGWVFDKTYAAMMRAGSHIVKAVCKPAPSLEAYLQTYYIASQAVREPAITPSGSLIVEISVNRWLEADVLKLALLASLPGITGLIMETIPPFTLQSIIEKLIPFRTPGFKAQFRLKREG